MMSNAQIEEAKRCTDMLLLCGEEGGIRDGESYSQYLRRLIDALIIAQRPR